MARNITVPRTTGISLFMELELKNIFTNPDQPRKSFENIDKLAYNISSKGLIQPIAVVKKENGYMIVSGERRFRACQLLDFRTIKANVLSADSKTIQELAFIENIQHEDLTDFEKAKHIGELWASGNYPQKQDLAKAIGKSQSYISKAFSCLKLNDEIIANIKETQQDISLSVLDEIARIKNPAIQKKVYKMYVAKEITRDDFKEIVTMKKSEKVSIEEKEISLSISICKGSKISLKVSM